MHKPDSSLLSNAGRYEAIFLFPLKIVRLDYFWDFIVLFTEKLKFHTNYRCKNCIKLKMHMLLVECVKPYNSFENRMKKCTWNCIEMIFLKIDCIWACASIQTLPESKSNENWKKKKIINLIIAQIQKNTNIFFFVRRRMSEIKMSIINNFLFYL